MRLKSFAPCAWLMRSEVRDLGLRGFFVRPHFLPPGLAEAVLGRSRNRALRPGLVGGRALRHDVALRTDETCWLSPEDEPEVFETFRAFGAQLEAEARLVLSRFDLQLACYRAGSGGYGDHFDSAEGGRRLSVTCYLSDLRSDGDGGELVMAPLDGAPEVAVRPAPGLAVCFRSDTVRHRVMPSGRERWALTAWFY